MGIWVDESGQTSTAESHRHRVCVCVCGLGEAAGTPQVGRGQGLGPVAILGEDAEGGQREPGPLNRVSLSLPNACPSPADMAGAPGSQSDEDPSSPDEEGSSTRGAPEGAQPSLPDAFGMRLADLVAFLLLKYRTQQRPTTQAEMLAAVSQDDQDHVSGIFRQACEYLQLVFGVDVKEADARDHSFFLVTILGLICDGMLSSRQGMPTASLLVLVLGVVLLENNCAPEEEVWNVRATN
ncbi:LOW QUALITY PROTEIN: melanoma-associated antigen 10-like [Lynx rufus]|uniref:LOW QUALITY PROTEIN: melanoma-associated antigen 10-like n=1 Tax=Lynx rufus TaxID=61384 RepID=UPI001F128307|nr:LOW QUALITY PROTEIN: melanoma-associated antigen 10-like [Lynx rufus]XP_046954260.1 LOW QUALITY PROTEIN: melanoma-associated antigen 10-like [Lynx rufus]XP_046954261.1 LOW QUALITY PROTEIN: melanoma-associated antigen 10-like [Lynx rufus]XP_046954262.1 LOW QUALITY PROTEIN: melanoma-associated antigen 10-like [Lynx rufus]